MGIFPLIYLTLVWLKLVLDSWDMIRFPPGITPNILLYNIPKISNITIILSSYKNKLVSYDM